MIKKLCLAVFSFFMFLLACNDASQSGKYIPTVDVFKVTTEEVPIYQEFVGQVYGKKDIAIRARVEGYLEGIFFKEGRQVKKGDLLYAIESQPFEEQVAAQMSMLAEAQTMLAKARSDLNRIRPLAEENAVSQSDLDAAVAQYEAAQAEVEAAKAKLNAARINLGYTRVRTPIDGIIGGTQAKVGDFVGRAPNPVILNVVSQIDTILVQFFITESDYMMVARAVQQSSPDTGEMSTPARERSLELILSDNSVFPHKGYFDFIDRGVDPTTGAILIQASFPNPDRLIRPGQFARIRARVNVVPEGILIPQRCVMELQGFYNVYVVSDSNKVELRQIALGPKISNFWLVRQGLTAGEKVIYEGLQKVRPGMVVKGEVKEIPMIKREPS